MTQEEITRNFDSYQSKSKTFLLGKFERMRKANLAKYCALGLCEESGEVAVYADKFDKVPTYKYTITPLNS